MKEEEQKPNIINIPEEPISFLSILSIQIEVANSILQNHVRITSNGGKLKEISFDNVFLLGNMSEKDMEQRRKETPSHTFIQVKDYTISRYHIKVECTDNKLQISDLGSANGTYLCNPDDIEDYELEIEKEFIVGDTTMVMNKKNNNTSDFCLYILDGYLSGVEFICKCNSQNSFYFRNGDLRSQMISPNDVNESLIIFDEERYKKQKIHVEIKWDEKTKKLSLQKNEQIGYWIRISNCSYPGTKTKQSEKAVVRLGNKYFVYINSLEQ